MFQAIVLACMVGSANCVMLLSEELDAPTECTEFYEEVTPFLKLNELTMVRIVCREIKQGQPA
tara:strand:+ start:80 stop:268 length:189 start_codon:yes stop_codon:yes gene_type:complete